VSDPRVSALFEEWRKSLDEPFVGVTSDGVQKEGLWTLEDQGAPTAVATVAANQLIELLNADEKLRALHPLDSEDWYVAITQSFPKSSPRR
jgi:hypothetical protein